VFPQEQLDKTFDVALSQSFQATDRVDDVSYMIRQKPKCWNGDTENPQYGLVTEDENQNFVCADQGYQILPILCPYLSKHELTDDGTAPDGENDDPGLNAFHGLPGDWTLAKTWDTQVVGHLAKSQADLSDTWDIDLKTPCFEGSCAQDWADFVHGVNAEANPEDYVQPADNEHKVFGCDLWVEVMGISLPNGDLGCNDQSDTMLVLDRSGSINSTELSALKTAAKAFVDALSLSTSGNHAGEASFETTASLDQQLTDDATTLKGVIDGLTTGNLTNLEAGILTAKAELESVRDRDDNTSPDFMIIITDGAPTASNGSGTDEQDAIDAATAAKNAGITIYVVGIGTTGSTETFLKDNIATDANHYFGISDYGALQAILEGLASCNQI